jgi:hypothetical protein
MFAVVNDVFQVAVSRLGQNESCQTGHDRQCTENRQRQIPTEISLNAPHKGCQQTNLGLTRQSFITSHTSIIWLYPSLYYIMLYRIASSVLVNVFALGSNC